MARKKSKINSSRTIKIVLIVLAVLIVAAAATAGGAYYYIQVLRPNQALVRAEAAFAAKDWKTAKIEYSTWLSKYPRDVDALLRYADCN